MGRKKRFRVGSVAHSAFQLGLRVHVVEVVLAAELPFAGTDALIALVVANDRECKARIPRDEPREDVARKDRRQEVEPELAQLASDGRVVALITSALMAGIRCGNDLLVWMISP